MQKENYIGLQNKQVALKNTKIVLKTCYRAVHVFINALNKRIYWQE